MKEWKNCTLGELGKIVGGATPSTKKFENYEGGTIPWITPKDLSGFLERYIAQGERNITEAGLRSCSAAFYFHPEPLSATLPSPPVKFVRIRDSKVSFLIMMWIICFYIIF